MKTIIIYSSFHHQNTEKIAKEMAKILKAKLIKTKELEKTDLKRYDLIGFGSGIYHGKFHEKLRRSLNKIDIKGKNFFVFSTSGWGIKKYNKIFIDQLKNKGGKFVDDFACKGFDTYAIFKLFGGIAKGRPNNQDLQEAKKFAKIIKNN